MPLALRFAQSDLGERLLERLSTREARNPPYRIQNEYFTVEAHPPSGEISLLDRRTGQVYNGLGGIISGGDAGDEYNYSPPEQDHFVAAKMIRARVRPDPVTPALVIDYRLEAPSSLSADRSRRSTGSSQIEIHSTASLPTGAPRLEFTTTITNRAKDQRLRVHFPTPIRANHAIYDGHYEAVIRPIELPEFDKTWQEEPRPEAPQRTFVAVCDDRGGVILANRGLPEVEVFINADGLNEIALTLLRCVEWLSRDDLHTRLGHAGPAEHTPGAQMLGTWTFHYAFIPHPGNWQDHIRHAYAYETPMRAVSSPLQEGLLPPSGSFIRFSPENFIISAIKESEDGRGWVLRGYNNSDQPSAVVLTPLVPFSHIEIVNLAEEPLSLLQGDLDGSVRFTARPYEIVSLRFRSR